MLLLLDLMDRQVNIAEMVVEDSYAGPRLPEDGTVTKEFVMEMMESFKSQRLIHRKYLLQILLAAKQFHETQSSLLRISLPVDGEWGGHINVCGDTHGQFFDLCNIFEVTLPVFFTTNLFRLVGFPLRPTPTYSMEISWTAAPFPSK